MVHEGWVWAVAMVIKFIPFNQKISPSEGVIGGRSDLRREPPAHSSVGGYYLNPPAGQTSEKLSASRLKFQTVQTSTDHPAGVSNNPPSLFIVLSVHTGTSISLQEDVHTEGLRVRSCPCTRPFGSGSQASEIRWARKNFPPSAV